MLPSPTAPRANDKIIPHQSAPDAVKSARPLAIPLHHDPEQFEFDQHILLSPPPPTNNTDRFDNDFRQLATGALRDTGSIQYSNSAAHVLNSRNTMAHSEEEQSQSASDFIATGLQIRTDIPSSLSPLLSASLDSDSYLRHSISTPSMPKRTPSIRAALHSSAGSLSPGAGLSSPQLAAMLNMTPLPSPIDVGRDPWRVNFRTRSRDSSLATAEAPSERKTSSLSPPSSPPKRKTYNDIRTSIGDSQAKFSDLKSENDGSGHSRHRSISDYVPDAIVLPKPRNVAVSSLFGQESNPAPLTMHREQYLAVQRGFSVLSPPLKPPVTSISTQESSGETDAKYKSSTNKVRTQIYSARDVTNDHLRNYKSVRLLGQGTFSKVFLAVRQVDNEDNAIDYARDSTNLDGVRMRSRMLVAVKVVEQGSAGGADAERVQVSLQREVEVLKAINHPSLVHLKAFGEDNGRSLLVLNYCPGGDLFEIASTQLEILVPSLVRRIFAELVSAVRYLHQKYIVHRDIKLESK